MAPGRHQGRGAASGSDAIRAWRSQGQGKGQGRTGQSARAGQPRSRAVAGARDGSASKRTRVGHVGDLAGKVGLIVGVANKRSLSWAIAQAAAAAGATLVLTYQGRFEEHVGELADTLTPRPLVLPLDVQNDSEIDAVFARIQQEHGGLDFVVHGVAFANRDDITNPFVQTSRDGFGWRWISAPTRSSRWRAGPRRSWSRAAVAASSR